MIKNRLNYIFATIILLVMCVPAFSQQAGTVNTDILNVRSAPSMGDNIIATLTTNDKVTILETKKEWTKITTAKGVTGWVATVYIDAGGKSDGESILNTAQAVFDTSYTLEKQTSGSVTEQYKVYTPYRVFEAASLVEKALATPGLKSEDLALLLRGKCKTVLGWYASNYDPKFFEVHEKEYSYNPVGANYIYKGEDFRTIIKKYPKSDLVDDAAFELANLPKPGECEGDASCMFERELNAFEPFFKQYPASPLALRGIELINASSIDLWLTEDGLDTSNFTFDRPAAEKLLGRYRAAAEALKTPDRVAALHPIADAYAAFGRKDAAAAIYKEIIADFPKYEALDHIRKSFDALGK